MSVKCRPILLQKSFWGGDRKFLKPLMRFTRGEVRDHIGLFKIDHASFVTALKKSRSDREARRSTFARFLGLFDFRLLQQYLPEGDIDSAMGGKRPPEGGPSLRKESFPSDVNLDGKIGAYPIRLPGLQSLSLKFSEGWIVTN